MKLEEIRDFCLSLSGATEDVKWENDLVFSIGGKMFAAAGMDRVPLSISFKVSDEEFEELSQSENFRPAPYLARAKWVMVNDAALLEQATLKSYLKNSYSLVLSKLPKKVRSEFNAV